MEFENSPTKTELETSNNISDINLNRTENSSDLNESMSSFYDASSLCSKFHSYKRDPSHRFEHLQNVSYPRICFLNFNRYFKNICK